MYLGILTRWKNKKATIFLKHGIKLSMGAIVDGYEGFIIYKDQFGEQDVATDHIATIVSV